MKPIVIPASTATTFSAGGLATSLGTIISWASEQFWHVTIPGYVYGAIVGVLTTIGAVVACHMTVDSPPTAAVKEAVDDAADRAAVQKKADEVRHEEAKAAT